MSDMTTIPTEVLRAALEAVVPGDVVLVTDVTWDMKTPCADCPFLRTSPYHGGVAKSLPDYIDSIQSGCFAHTCHKTDRRPTCDGPHAFKGENPKHCAGAILMLLKTGHGMDLQIPMLVAAEAGKLDIDDMAARAKRSPDVFNVLELLDFYSH